MNVLSLFDGMSCGQIALDQLGVKVDNYYASEIDKYAIKVTQKNYPNTKQIGSVTEVKGKDLPKIDLIICGSPCQGFSFAGKQLNFNDPRSALFFQFVRLLRECKPKYFLLENVKMKKEYQEIISEHLGVEPVMINSALVSAQNRVRLYWTNIPGLIQPEDKGLVLKDIIEDGVVDRTKSHCLDANYFKGGNLKSYFEKHRRQLVFSKNGLCHVGDADLKGNDSIKRVYHPDGKSPTLTTMQGGHREPKIAVKSIQVGTVNKGGQGDRIYSQEGKGISLTAQSGGTAGNGNMLIQGGGGHREPKVLCGRIVGRKINPNTGKRDDYNPDLKAEQRLEPRLDEKSGTLTTVQKDNVVITHLTYRKLTPLECERLQTVPDGYTAGVSNTQRYKLLCNGFTVDVIKHILQEMI